MNIRLDGQSARFRISAEELEMLREGRVLQDDVDIGADTLSLVLDPTGERDQLKVRYKPGSITMQTSSKKIRELADLGRSRDGLQEDRDGITVSLQVDFRTQKRKTSQR